ncbi:xanthine dehydrogenase family protein subunit M [Candidatus Poribacteria bacterium]|nr:xanthine dehydrogenase family protein subunit M [Candidatus Poribacteria bacterium]
MIDCQYLEPTTVSEACTLLAEHGDGAKVVAGGQSMAILLRNGLIQPSHLISIQHISGLEDIIASDEGVKIGAKVTLDRLIGIGETHPTLRALDDVIGDVADQQIRNFATLGGAICEAHPASDISVVLSALNASVKLASADGERVVPISDFVTDAFATTAQSGELLTEVIVPSFDPTSAAAAHRRFVLRAGDYPVAGVGAFVSLDGSGQCQDVRIIVGNCSGAPVRAREAEARLKGHGVVGNNGALAEAGELAASHVAPSSDPMAPSEYKIDLVNVLTREALAEAIARATG